MGLKVAGTGHRPDKLGGYSDEAFNHLVEIAENCFKQIKPSEVISGMALGWDMAMAQAAINMNIPLIAAVPFIGQEKMWPKKSQDKFNNMLKIASEVIIVSEGGYERDKMQIRNIWMVNNCDLVIAMHDGSTGGTNNCVKYATKMGKKMVNLYGKLNKN